jgi:hypothetical protein
MRYEIFLNRKESKGEVKCSPVSGYLLLFSKYSISGDPQMVSI